jgi:hypothetical protein
MRATRGFRPCRRATLSLVALTMLSVAACGGDAQSGEPTVPQGYETYRGQVVSFAYPADWTVQRLPRGKVRIQPPTSSRPRSGIQLNESADLRGTFDSVVAARRDFAEGTGETQESTEEVELEGAERAVRYEGRATIAGADFDAGGISVLLEDGAGAFLSVDILESDGRPEVDTIVDSLRVNRR